MWREQKEGSWDSENVLFLCAGLWLCSICKESVTCKSKVCIHFYLLHFQKFFRKLHGQILYINFNVYSKTLGKHHDKSPKKYSEQNKKVCLINRYCQKISTDSYLIIRNLFDKWIPSCLLKNIQASLIFSHKFFSLFPVVIPLKAVNHHVLQLLLP